MKNSMNIVSATAGLAKIAKEHNASKLADDYRISLGLITTSKKLIRQEYWVAQLLHATL